MCTEIYTGFLYEQDRAPLYICLQKSVLTLDVKVSCGSFL